MEFIKGQLYTRKEVHQMVLGKPLPKIGTGNWLTGYVKVHGNLFIFANVGDAGRTGHNFPNFLDSDSGIFTWYGKPDSHSEQVQIKKLLHGELQPYIFIRFDSSDPKFEYLGMVEIESFKDHVKVKMPERSCTAIEVKYKILSKVEAEVTLQDITFEDIMQSCLKRFHDKNVKTNGLEGRLSGKFTLHEAGILEEVSRERIRQKEADFLRYFSKYRARIAKALMDIEFNFTKPLYLWELEQLSDFFLNVSNRIKSEKSPLLEVFKSESSPFNIDIVNKLVILYPKNRPSFKDVVDDIQKNFLDDAIDDYLFAVQRTDIAALVKTKVTKIKPKSIQGQIKYYLDREIASFDRLVKIKDILNLFKEKYDLIIQPNELSSVLSRKFTYFCQFDSNLWGDEKKFGINSDQATKELMNRSLEIIHSHHGLLHVSDIFKEISNDFDQYLNRQYIQKITPYHLDWCLRKFSNSSHQVINHNRGRWESKKTNTSSQSMKVVDLVSEFLEEAGKPMKFSAIKQYIKSRRSVSQYFQLRPSMSNGDLVLVEPSLWGLRYRDLKITEEQETVFIDLILDQFNSGKSILVDSNLREIAKRVKFDSDVTFFQYSRLLMCHTSSQPMRSKYFFVKFHKKNTDKCMVIDIKSDVDFENLKIE